MESTMAEITSGPPGTGDSVKEEIQEGPPPLDTKVPFPEILRLVQTGQDIPGLQKLNITATNESPTPSRMAPKPKPWENKS